MPKGNLIINIEGFSNSNMAEARHQDGTVAMGRNFVPTPENTDLQQVEIYPDSTIVLAYSVGGIVRKVFGKVINLEKNSGTNNDPHVIDIQLNPNMYSNGKVIIKDQRGTALDILPVLKATLTPEYLVKVHDRRTRKSIGMSCVVLANIPS